MAFLYMFSIACNTKWIPVSIAAILAVILIKRQNIYYLISKTEFIHNIKLKCETKLKYSEKITVTTVRENFEHFHVN